MNIYDIAKEAGVSISTVSRVINNRSRVSKETSQKIKEIMDKHNYTPNPVARGLVSKSIRNIGIVAVDIRGTHYAEIAYSAVSTFNDLGYSCILCNAGQDFKEEEKHILMMLENVIDGMIFIGSTFQSNLIKKIIKKHIPQLPVVMINGFFDLPNVYGIQCDDEVGIIDSIKYILRNGNKKTALIRGNNNTVSNDKKEKGYKSILKKYNIEPIVYTALNSVKGGYDITLELVNKVSDIEAIIYTTDIIASGGIKALAHLNKNVPNEIEVIGYNNTLLCDVLTPTLTSVENQSEQIGTGAARILHDVIEGRKAAKNTIILPEMVLRESTNNDI